MQTQTNARTTNVRANTKPISTAAQAPVVATPEAHATIPLKALIAEAGLPPDGKLVRRALRKAMLSWHSHADRWEFTPAQANEARAIIAKLKLPKASSRAVKATAIAGTDAP